jgi:CHAT domain-containing protein/lipopolysaccharide biosynthesis regulator YciM
MSSAFRVSSLSMALSLSLICPAFPQAQSPSSAPPTVARPTAESDLRAVVEKYFALYAGKDLEGLMSLWSEKSPNHASFKQSLQLQFAAENYSFSLPAITRLKVEGERAGLRATVNLTAINLKNNQKREQRIARNFALVSEDGKWKVWRSAPAENDLAEALAKSKTEAERAGLLADEKELVTPELALALGTQGDRFYTQGAYPEALSIYRLEQSLVDRIGARAGVARAFNHIGNVQLQQGDYAQALESFQASLTISEALGDKTAVANAMGSIGRVHLLQGDYARALESFQASLTMSEAQDDKAGIARALAGFGQIHFEQGDSAQALERFQQSLAIREALRDDAGIGAMLNSIGRVHYQQGDYARALELHQKSLAISESRGDKAGIAIALNNIGVVYRIRGDYARALERYRKSLTMSEDSGRKSGIAVALHNIGNLYRLQGTYAQSFESFQKSLALREEIGDKAGIASVLSHLGLFYRLQGDYAQALERFQRSLALSEALGNKAGIARALISIGRVYNSQGNHAQAIEYYQRSLALREAIGNKAEVADTLNNIGEVYVAQGRYSQALDAASRTAALAREIGYAEILWKARLVAGVAYRALNEPVQARLAFEEAITTIETLRANVAGGAEEQQRFFESKVSPYHAMVDLLTRDGRPAEALIFAERAKARALLDALQTGRVNGAKAMTAQEHEKEQKLHDQLVALNTQISREAARPKPDQARLAELNARLPKARLDFESFQTNLYAAHRDLRAQRGEVQPLRLEEAAALLPDAASALLEYVVTDDKTYLFAITKTAGKTEPEVGVYTLPVKRDELDKQAEFFRRQLAGRDLGFRASAAKLYELLLKPADAQLRGKTNLVIAPDDKLWDLPFQALLAGANRFLIEDAAITYAPSLTVLREMTNRLKNQGANPAPATLLALGNPLLGRETVNRAALPLRDEKLDPLPEAEKEVRAISRLYGSARSKVYIGADAREDLIKTEAAQARVLHFATHGILNNASPMYSHLALARGDTNEDGLLEAWELMQLNLKADLAVLSACETARGRFGAGEGVIGLSWAMFIAGVPSIVVSQWKVESASARDLMISFHRQALASPAAAKSKATKAEALRQAALKMMKNPETRHPFYWAGFVLVGDGE